ncbi:hypothetical protein QLH51_05635 [Sphingomonas sp. 2R-10]|uniref:hypothetical protein n=1 Tax=Sphingomonas sp. 2R-10 TaxID=3045148 RepID=UPI0019D1991B|nr:hypothetical protein [Sphingomonas sp. 2R-10]MDJ0276279.1 hypothetical protein [Sphingomonas sp. 2R-10]
MIDLSLRILCAAMARSGDRRVDTIEVRLAQRCLVEHCPERWPLDSFWASAAAGHDIGRAQGCTAAFNEIVRQLRVSGSLADG